MGYILRIGYRHIDAIKFQTIASLSFAFAARREFSFEEWLKQFAPELQTAYENIKFSEDSALKHHQRDERNYAITLNTIVDVFEHMNPDPEMRSYFMESMKSSSSSDHANEDYFGSELGGKWDPEAFILRGAIILTLGALEGFERGVIRILTGSPIVSSNTINKPGVFKPCLADFQYESPEWIKLDKSRKTFTSRGRAEILERFGIKRSIDDWASRLDIAWRYRNKIAHGYEAVEISFWRFLQVHYDVFRAMRNLAKQSLDLCRIEI